MCGSCNQTPIMSDDAVKVSPATQKQQATLSAGVGIALLIGIGAGAAIIMNRKGGGKSSAKRSRKGSTMSDAKVRMYTGKMSRQPKYVLAPDWEHIDYVNESGHRLTLAEIINYFEANGLKVKKFGRKPINEDVSGIDVVIFPHVDDYWWGRIDVSERIHADDDRGGYRWKHSKLAEYSEPSRKSGRRK